jgi:DNA-binding NarL/FixJ family response regulator
MDRARELAAGIPGARLVTVEGKTHDPFIRDVGDVVEAILASVEGRNQVLREAPESPSQDVEPLTSRESQVLGAVAEGASNKQVVSELGVSVATVERHLTNIYRKLGASGRADAAVRAIRAGILGSEASDATDG